MRLSATALWASLFALLGVTQDGVANLIVTPKQYVPALVTAETVLVDVYTLGGYGAGDNDALVKLVASRMEELGFNVVTDISQPHDVAVQMTCKDPTRRFGVGLNGVQPKGGRTARTVNGPPCSLEYFFEGQLMQWQRVDRIVFTLGVKAAGAAFAEKPEAEPLEILARYLNRYEYPLLLTAEWGQVDRLRVLLQSPNMDTVRKRMVIALLGEIHADQAMGCLLQALQDESLAQAAALALGHFGHNARGPLIKLLRTSAQPDVQAAAARSLGQIGATTGDWSLTPLFIEVLERPNLDIVVQIELVWALGKNPDRRSLPILEELYNKAWGIRSDDPRLQQLRAAIDWSHRAVRLGGHTDEY